MTLSQIQNRIYRLTKTNSTSYPNSLMLDDINIAYERVASLILQLDSRWIWDDNNQTTIPIATTNIVSSQQTYELATTHLKINRVEIAVDTTGLRWETLDVYDMKDEYLSLTQQSLNSGIPYRYAQIGSNLFLDPIPNYSYSNGLKVYFQRGPLLFTSGNLTTGTIIPGFNSLYHDLIPLWVAYDFSLIHGKKNTNQIMLEIQRKEKTLRDNYLSNNISNRKKITFKKIKYI
jgi:hypothetical protein